MKGPIDPVMAGCGVALVLRYPWLATGLLVPMLTPRYRLVRSRRKERERSAIDPMVVARVIQVGLAGGLPLASALTLAVGEVGLLVGAELNATLRTARREGIAASMAASTGLLLRPLFARIALAQTSGAPMHEAVAAFVAESRAARRGLTLERVRRLPVTLMIPLGLLILPGFVLLFVGPIVLTSMLDLSRGLP
jgi:ABC-type Co2+ transport system permease subunit